MQVPVILFGAFDRHNFGDLLFPHVVAAMLGADDIRFAGLAARDMRPAGGHLVQDIGALAAEFGNRPVRVIHAGGELLGCSGWEAAVMLLSPEEARAAIGRFDGRPAAAAHWAQTMLGTSSPAPYAAGGTRFAAAEVFYHAVGGVELGLRETGMQAEVMHCLRHAARVSVRDRRTRSLLAAAGIRCALIPDPAVMTAELFGERISRHARQGEAARLRARFPRGYCAVQFNAAFGDDASLAALAAALDRVIDETGLGVALFAAGTAPWHDDPDCYRRLLARMRSRHAAILASRNLWDICALLSRSELFFGTSLHGRIVAMAFGVPRLNLVPEDGSGRPCKQIEFAATWEADDVPYTVTLPETADGMLRAMRLDRPALAGAAARLAAAYRGAFDLNPND